MTPFPYLFILLFIISAHLCLGGKRSKTFDVKDERWWYVKTAGGGKDGIDYKTNDFKDADDIYQDYEDDSEPNGTVLEKLFSS